MRLQIIDSKIQNILNRFEDIETFINETEELKNSEKLVLEAKTNLAEIQKLLHQSEINVKDQQIKIEQTENALYGGKIRNPKELQDLQNEAAALKRYLDVLVDRQIEAMITFEEAEVRQKNATMNYEKIRTEKLHQNKNFTSERIQLDLDLKSLYIEREAVIQTINNDDLDTYEKLRDNRRGLAVSKIVDHTCSACGTTLSPAIRQSAQSPAQIVQCPSCRRILYPG